FSQIKPLKRGGGRRHYRPDDVQLLKGIRHLLYDQGFTIKGVQRILKDQATRHVIAIGETGMIRPIAPALADAPQVAEAGAGTEEPSLDFAADSPAERLSPAAPLLDEKRRAQLQSVLDALVQCRQALDKARGV